MTLSDNARLIESILYLENEPLSVERICKMTGLSEKDVSDALSEISEVYYTDNHGLALVENSETFSFVPVARHSLPTDCTCWHGHSRRFLTSTMPPTSRRRRRIWSLELGIRN